MSKPRLQARLAALSFSEKIKILEKLRDREKAIAAAGLRKNKSEPMELATGWDIARVVGVLVGKDRAKSRAELAEFLQIRYAQRFFAPISLLEKEATRGIKWPKDKSDPDEPIRAYGFAIMSLACQMIETLQSYRKGIPTTSQCDFHWMTNTDGRYKNSPKQVECSGGIQGTKEVFVSFFTDYGSMFPGLEGKGDEFFRNVRNALLHQSQTRNGWRINIHQYEEAPDKIGEVYVDARKTLYRDSFMHQLGCCFNNFIEDLRRHPDEDLYWEKPERKIWWIAWLSDPEYLTDWVKRNPAYARSTNVRSETL
jgi:hypothetical protein